MRTLSSALALSLLLLGCGHDRPVVRLATEGSVFDLGGSGTVAEAIVPFTVTNRSDQTIFLPACGARPAVAVERGDGRQWSSYAAGFCITNIPQTPIELRPGERLTSDYTFHEPGYFRIRLSWGGSPSTIYDKDIAASNGFRVR